MMSGERQGRRGLLASVVLLAAFALWTALIQCVDVQPVGQNGTDIGCATFNAWFHGLTGVHMWVYTLTDWLGLMPVFGNGADGPSPVSLVGLASSSPWVKPVFAAVIGLTALCGL